MSKELIETLEYEIEKTYLDIADLREYIIELEMELKEVRENGNM